MALKGSNFKEKVLCVEAAYVVIINASVGFQGLPQVPPAEVLVSHEYGTFNFSTNKKELAGTRRGGRAAR